MAELLGEEWSVQVSLLVVLYGGWDSGSGLLSSSPLTLVNTDSFIRANTFLDKSSIVSDVSWSAEVLIWDQGFSVTPNAFCKTSGFF